MQFNKQIIDDEDVVQMISPMSSCELIKFSTDEQTAKKYDIKPPQHP